MRLYGTQRIQENGVLQVGGVSITELKEKYGTPLYIMDEEALRERAGTFRKLFTHEKLETEVIYASKAFMTKAMARLIDEENLSLDVVSGGELYTALSIGFKPERIYFHGNNKSSEELKFAVESEVGTIILDNGNEANRIQRMLEGSDRMQKVLLRVNPGIDAHTHEYISTTKNDSKFGLSIYMDETIEVIKNIMKAENMEFMGLHCHIGSQIFEESSFMNEVSVIMSYLEKLKGHGIKVREMDMGGGFGVEYVDGDRPIDLTQFFPTFLENIYQEAANRNLLPLKIMIEPGRAITANAGITLYEVGGTKETLGEKTYVFVDGSMADHIRTVLYDASYEAVMANRMHDPLTTNYTVTGKACESGDILVRNASLPRAVEGDLLAVLTTGAYHYSMASNYNRLPKPPVVFVKDGKSRVVVRRETYEDLVRNDVDGGVE
ncbi:MAG: diaminopimelate decarboxylase [Clostridiaceae bacterium]